MDWISANWIWILFAVAFVAMHLFGHGGHGGHSHGSDEESPRRSPTEKRGDDSAAGHQH